MEREKKEKERIRIEKEKKNKEVLLKKINDKYDEIKNDLPPLFIITYSKLMKIKKAETLYSIKKTTLIKLKFDL